MITVTPLNEETVAQLEAPYSDFSLVAQSEYKWDGDPIDFAMISHAVRAGWLQGFLIYDSAETEPVGFMLYRLEDHRAIEINALYVKEHISAPVALDRAMRKFIDTVKDQPGWDVVSFPMMGKHHTDFINHITWYGFRPVGQAIVKFDFLDSIAVQILQQQCPDPLPEGYKLDTWQPHYAGASAKNIHAAFENSSDAKWDPRFRTELGARRALHFITSSTMGDFHKDCTSILLHNDEPVGFCFLIQGSTVEGNIPLIGVHPDHKGKKLGSYLLKQTLMNAIQAMVDSKIAMVAVTATLDTDNFPAIRMYRHMGFKEEYNYPHVYLTQERAQTVKAGQWC